jgi:hypothetical protein
MAAWSHRGRQPTLSRPLTQGGPAGDQGRAETSLTVASIVAILSQHTGQSVRQSQTQRQGAT